MHIELFVFDKMKYNLGMEEKVIIELKKRVSASLRSNAHAHSRPIFRRLLLLIHLQQFNGLFTIAILIFHISISALVDTLSIHSVCIHTGCATPCETMSGEHI